MAKDYSAAIERMREKAKEAAAKNVAPSSLPSPPATEKKDYTEAIARMRRLSNITGVRAKAAEMKAKQQQEWIDTRTQDVIRAELEAAKNNDTWAAPFSKEAWTGGIETTKALFSGNLKELREERKANDALVPKLEEELARRQAYDYAALTQRKDFETTVKNYVPKPEFDAFGNPKINLDVGYMTDEQRDIYNYLKATEGDEAANEYKEYISAELNAARVADYKKGLAEIAEKSPVGASLMSVGTGALRGFGYLGQAADTLVGKELDPNAWYNIFSHTTSGLRDAVTKNWGPVGSFAYNTGMSMLDFLAATGMTGGGGAASVILGSGAAADTTIDALERGVPSERAFLMGTAAGLIEAVTEKVSVEKLLENYSEKGIKQFIFSNMISEASEEAASEIANTITDVILAEDKSYWIIATNEYKEKGYSESEAFWRVLGDKLGETGLAALGGALSGGIMSGGRVAINTGVNALQNAGDAAAQRDNAYRGQNTIRDILNSDKYKDMRNEQKKYTVLPTAVDEEIKAARDRGEVFDIGYDKPYTGVADTLDDVDLQRKIDAAETLTEKTGLRHGAKEQDIADAIEMSRALGVEIEFFNQSSKATNTVVDGFYNAENGHIYVNVNAAKGKADNSTIPVVISHEFTHSLEGTDAYNDLRQLVEKELKKRGDSIEAAAERLNTVYEKSGRGQSMKANEADVIANFVEKNVLGSKESIQSIVGAKPNFGRRVLAFLNRILAQFRRGSSAYTTVNQIRDQLADAMSSEAENAPTADGVIENVAYSEDSTGRDEENAQQDEASENEADEEVITEEETPATKDSEGSQERATKSEKKPAETKKSPERENRGSKADTGTVVFDDAEDMMREAERAHDAGEITDEQLSTVEGWYDQWYETGMKPDMSSDGFEEGKIPRGLRRFFTGRSGMRWSVSDLKEDYFTYQNLVAKPDMKITQMTIPATYPKYGKPTRQDVVKAALDNARSMNNPRNTDENIFVRNLDTDADILINASSISHGLYRKYQNNAIAASNIGSLIENAILVNKHIAREGMNEGGVYLSVGKDSDNVYVCRIITNENNVMQDIEVMYALNTKKESVAHYRLDSTGNPLLDTDSTISIADLLELVKKYFADVLPNDVLREMNMQRPKSTVSDSMKYSVSTTTNEAETDTTTDAYTVLPTKAKTYLRKVEDRIGRAFDRALELGLAGENGGYRTKDFKEFLTDAVRPITNEYLTTGTVSRETISGVFEKYYKSPNGLPSSLYDQAKMDARGVFENIINENWNDLNYVRRYAEATNREKAKLENMAEITREDARKRFDTLKSAQKFERKVMRDNLLTDDDMLTVGKLLRKEISFENLNPIKDNVKGIRAVYETKLQTLEASEAVAEYKRYVKAQYYAYWDGKLDTMFEWKDKGAGIRYQRETLERNIRDIVPDKALADQIIREVIYPVHKHEADSTKWKTDMKKRVEALGLSTKVKRGDTVSESYAVQFYGEAIDNIKMLEANPDRRAKRDGYTLEEWKAALNNMWEKSPRLDETKIKNAAEEFRKIYEEIFEQMNDVRLDNGYAPVAHRRGYFPHFTGEEETLLAKFGRAMGIKTEMMALPTTINGLTENFKPGITWFGHAQERQGNYTTYDAVTGFEQYIKGAADVIFHTEDIQRFRALANRIRYNASSDGIRAEMDKIEANEELDDAQKDAALEEIRHNGKYALSNFVAYIDEYTNKLANKKSKLDRGIESLFGRRIYMVVNNLESRVAANMIAANLGSAMTNFIPINQAASQLGWGWMLKGLQGTYKSVAGGDNIRDASTFLVNRRGYDPIVKNWLDKASDIAQMPMEFIDTIASEMIVRAAYAKNLDSGMTSDEALYQADLFAASVMADRSKGAVPLIFENKNPIMKLFTQFQVEVNNEFSVIFKDIPRRERKKWTDAIALVLLKYFLGAFLYNELYELIVGRRAALDPIGIAVDTAEDIAQGKNTHTVVNNLGTNLLEELPFVGGVMGGGRIPISNAMPNWENLLNAVTSEGKNPKKRAAMIWKEASAPLYYWILPFGGGQLKKIVQTVDTAIQGGRYTLDKDGNPQLQYPMFMDTTADKILNPLRSLAFGTTSLPTAQDWIDNDFKTFGVKETAAYDALKEVGVSGRDAYDFLLDLRGAEKTEERSLDAVKRDIIRDSDLSVEGKFVAYRTLVAKEKEQELMDNLDDLGADPGEVVDLMLSLKDAAKDIEKRELILNSNLEDDEKRLVYENRITMDHSEAILAFEDAGLDFDTFLKAKNFDAQISENKELSTSERATEFARWVNKQGFTAEQQAVIRDNIREYTKSTKYDDFTDAGLDDETAYKLTSALADLTPPEGKKQVTDLQKYRAVVDTIASPVEQMKALEAVMDESAFKQASAAVSYGIDPEVYVTFRESLTAFDSNGNGSLSQAEVETALNSMSGNLSFAEQLTLELTGGSSLVGSMFLSKDQLAVLWQLSNTGWAAKNNPYNPKVGQAVLDLLGKGERE